MGLKDVNRVMRLKQPHTLTIGRDKVPLEKGFQFEVIHGMVYSHGAPLEDRVQNLYKKWLEDNPELFIITNGY